MLDNSQKQEIDKKISDLVINFEEKNDSSFDIIKFVTKKIGFLVQSLNMGDETSGMLLYDKNNFVAGTNSHKLIVIKRGLPEEKSRFIVAHELGHYCLRNKDKPQLAHRENETIENDDELKAEYFARSILMPEENVRKFVELITGFDEKISKEKIIKLIAIMYTVTENKANIRYYEIYGE